MCHWLSSDSGYYSNASLLPFVLNFCFFLKSSQTLHNETYHVVADEVSHEVSRNLNDGFRVIKKLIIKVSITQKSFFRQNKSFY